MLVILAVTGCGLGRIISGTALVKILDGPLVIPLDARSGIRLAALVGVACCTLVVYRAGGIDKPLVALALAVVLAVRRRLRLRGIRRVRRLVLVTAISVRLRGWRLIIWIVRPAGLAVTAITRVRVVRFGRC